MELVRMYFVFVFVFWCGGQSRVIGVLKFGPLHIRKTVLQEGDNGLEGAIKRQENDDSVVFPAVWHSRPRDNDRGRDTWRNCVREWEVNLSTTHVEKSQH